jgi:hypothetical protein
MAPPYLEAIKRAFSMKALFSGSVLFLFARENLHDLAFRAASSCESTKVLIDVFCLSLNNRLLTD